MINQEAMVVMEVTVAMEVMEDNQEGMEVMEDNQDSQEVMEGIAVMAVMAVMAETVDMVGTVDIEIVNFDILFSYRTNKKN
jgi:hypothetical protein